MQYQMICLVNFENDKDDLKIIWWKNYESSERIILKLKPLTLSKSHVFRHERIQ